MKEKEIKRSFWESSKRFLEPYKTNEVIYIKGIFVAFLWGINGIVHVLFLERFTFYLQYKSVESFKIALISYLGYLILYELINFSVKKWGWVELFGYTWKYLAEYYLTKFVKLDNNKVESIGTGKLISIINSGIEKWGFLMWKIFERGMSLIIVILFTIYMVSKVNIYYSLIFIVLFYMFFKIVSYFNKKMIPFRGKRNENFINISRSIVKILMTKNEILQSNKIGEENKKIGVLYIKDADINKEMGVLRTFLNRSSQLGMAIILLFTYYFLGFQFLDGKIELNLLVGLGGALIIMQKSISDSLTFYIDFTKDFVSVEKLWDFFDTTPEIEGYETGKEFEYKSGAIELQNITFGYEENKKVFKDFNLKLNGGKITAFVGNSGGGKTTLVKIISQYIKQDSGEVIIDGQNLNEISLKSYYKNIGYLTQEPSVFDGTIMDNLTYALENNVENVGTGLKPVPTENLQERIAKIISLSKCEFIYDFEKGLETEIGERGVRLSGGQKQRLAIAKIMLKDPKIIILDEPTSALDSFSEELITKAMNNLFEGRTVLVIAHRLQTVKHADEIIVIENGEIRERGKHNELVEKNGIYNRMLELQSGF